MFVCRSCRFVSGILPACCPVCGDASWEGQSSHGPDEGPQEYSAEVAFWEDQQKELEKKLEELRNRAVRGATPGMRLEAAGLRSQMEHVLDKLERARREAQLRGVREAARNSGAIHSSSDPEPGHFDLLKLALALPVCALIAFPLFIQPQFLVVLLVIPVVVIYVALRTVWNAFFGRI